MQGDIVSKSDFANALREMGHDPSQYLGQKLPLSGMCELYGIDRDTLLDAIDEKLLAAHYDYRQDTIWVDALEAAYFFYCLRMDSDLAQYPAA